MWFGDHTQPSRTIDSNTSTPYSIFVTGTNEIYVDAGAQDKKVKRLMENRGYYGHVMEVEGTCTGLFVDINNTIYCSLVHHHKVIKRLSNHNISKNIIAAGNGSNLSTPYTLNQPYGIFVDLQLKLYVADRHNDRIQVFQPGNLTGQTILGNGSDKLVQLNDSIAILVNSYEDMFILESNGHRLSRLLLNDFNCIIGCDSPGGSQSNQLSFPTTFSFDTHGNIFVMDWGNNRIQKFLINIHSCSKFN